MPDPTDGRQRPPPRRPCETRAIAHRRADGSEARIAVTIGYDPVGGTRPVEVFYDGGYRSGSDLEFVVQDLCVIVSLLLQHGVGPEAIGRSLSLREEPDGTHAPGSLAGTIVAELSVPPAWARDR
ncbi:MAG: TSCPD domain-containing protein [Paracoccaceae bacterium]